MSHDAPMPEKVPEPGYYYHYKHDPAGSINNYAYYIYGVGHHTEDDCRPEDAFMQVYRPLYESAYVYRHGKMFDLRPLQMFYEDADWKGIKVPRFTKINDSDVIVQLKKDPIADVFWRVVITPSQRDFLDPSSFFLYTRRQDEAIGGGKRGMIKSSGTRKAYAASVGEDPIKKSMHADEVVRRFESLLEYIRGDTARVLPFITVMRGRGIPKRSDPKGASVSEMVPTLTIRLNSPGPVGTSEYLRERFIFDLMSIDLRTQMVRLARDPKSQLGQALIAAGIHTVKLEIIKLKAMSKVERSDLEVSLPQA